MFIIETEHEIINWDNVSHIGCEYDEIEDEYQIRAYFVTVGISKILIEHIERFATPDFSISDVIESIIKDIKYPLKFAKKGRRVIGLDFSNYDIDMDVDDLLIYKGDDKNDT